MQVLRNAPTIIILDKKKMITLLIWECTRQRHGKGTVAVWLSRRVQLFDSHIILAIISSLKCTVFSAVIESHIQHSIQFQSINGLPIWTLSKNLLKGRKKWYHMRVSGETVHSIAIRSVC